MKPKCYPSVRNKLSCLNEIIDRIKAFRNQNTMNLRVDISFDT